MTQASSVPRGSAPLIALLDQAQIRASNLIRVVGPHGLSALLWLCRHGFEQVGCLRPGQGCPHEQPDAILVAHSCDRAQLDKLLSTGPQVREGGVLIFQTALPRRGAPGPAEPMEILLQNHGYVVERSLRGAHRRLHVARRRAQSWKRAA
jgi:hypothetical protein